MNSVQDALRQTALSQNTPNMANNVTGGFRSSVPGRTDHLAISTPKGAYILPADIVSAMGEGNTQAGMRLLDQTFSKMIQAHQTGGAPPPQVNIAVAGGEYSVPPQVVAALGSGDMNLGHAVLDAFVKKVRAHNVKHLASLPGPNK